ncbi:MAG: NADPH:quinone oxidoreductase [Candidatus Solincola sediminis]|uniref:NADPH:quinone oxidoreductase n=1 Tax=Candidatus Solincola sediminis TaxID=1797199 RepID=A0A1F2WRM6_9ACTN|nr:MAG: NADPH:quinone oxidoreductase [Candidatus Solincola sediminis]
MKAIVYTRYGPPDVLQLKEVEKPTPKDNEVLIKVHATTVNRTDCGFRKPEYPLIIRLINGVFKPKRTILGSELAGEVEEVGKGVKLFKKGDQVFGLTGNKFGAHAEYICLPEKASIVTRPANMNYEEAAAVCDGAMLAFNFIRKINLQKGDKILIYGASGSIGTAAVQLAKYFGAEVTAVCNTKNLELVKSLGAEEVIDYTKDDFTQNGQSYKAVVDAVGKTSYFRCKKLIKKGGVYFSTDLGFLAQNLFLVLWTKIFGSKKVKFPIPKDRKEDVAFFKELIEAGKYKAVIDRRYPLEQIVEAYRYVEEGQKTGNVVIIV